MARLLGDWKSPKPAPHTAMRQMKSHAVPGWGIVEEQQSGCEGEEADAAEDARVVMPVGQPAGERRSECDGDRPGCHEQPRLDGAAPQLLDLERQRDERCHLCDERANGGGDREPEQTDAQQIER